MKRLIDYYELLEVNPRARTSVIDAAYKALIKEYHPDIGGSTSLSAKLNEAKNILLDKNKRHSYDKERANLTNKLIGNYRILEQIGEGGFGKTYKAEHIILNELACIKYGHEISKEDEEILINEAKAIWNLKHFGLPSMKDVIKVSSGNLALVTSFIPYPTLEKIVKTVGKLSAEHVAWIAERSLNVLGYLHFNGVVHGDIKPSNLLVDTKNHQITLIDFGLSTIRPKNDSSNLGYTPLFAAPEQIDHNSPPLPQSDFYSLGMTMIYALNGDKDTSALTRKKVPDDTPKPFKEFIERLLVYDIANRPTWKKENLVETLGEVRAKSFGRRRSNVLQIQELKGGKI